MDKIKELLTLIEGLENDGNSFYEKSNHAAGIRLRNKLQKLKVLTTDIRTDVLEKRKTA